MRQVLALLSATMLSAACTQAPTRLDPTPRGVGFQCLPVPSEWMEAGSVFEVDQKGVSARIGRVETVPVLKDGLVDFPAYTSNVTYNVGFLISTLETLTATTGWSASVGADGSSSAIVSSTYANLRLDITEGQPEAQAVAWFTGKGYKIEPGKRYYFVREAIRAKEASYEIKSADLIKLGGEVRIKELVQGKLDVFQRKADGSYQLAGKYASPLNVCIKPRELTLIRGADGQQILGFVDAPQVIAITAAK